MIEHETKKIRSNRSWCYDKTNEKQYLHDYPNKGEVTGRSVISVALLLQISKTGYSYEACKDLTDTKTHYPSTLPTSFVVLLLQWPLISEGWGATLQIDADSRAEGVYSWWLRLKGNSSLWDRTVGMGMSSQGVAVKSGDVSLSSSCWAVSLVTAAHFDCSKSQPWEEADGRPGGAVFAQVSSSFPSLHCCVAKDEMMCTSSKKGRNI